MFRIFNSVLKLPKVEGDDLIRIGDIAINTDYIVTVASDREDETETEIFMSNGDVFSVEENFHEVMKILCGAKI